MQRAHGPWPGGAHTQGGAHENDKDGRDAGADICARVVVASAAVDDDAGVHEAGRVTGHGWHGGGQEKDDDDEEKEGEEEVRRRRGRGCDEEEAKMLSSCIVQCLSPGQRAQWRRQASGGG